MPTLIDTHEAFRRLQRDGGFSDEQADAIVDLFRDADEQVATRSDILELSNRLDQAGTERSSVEERLTQRIELSEERLGQQIEQVRTEVTRTGVASVAAVGAILAVVIPLAIFLLG
jgi:gamma-glutamyl phosphate reductase